MHVQCPHFRKTELIYGYTRGYTPPSQNETWTPRTHHDLGRNAHTCMCNPCALKGWQFSPHRSSTGRGCTQCGCAEQVDMAYVPNKCAAKNPPWSRWAQRLAVRWATRRYPWRWGTWRSCRARERRPSPAEPRALTIWRNTQQSTLQNNVTRVF